jgi:formylglycine-generating enzyme required for sulfatase activity
MNEKHLKEQWRWFTVIRPLHAGARWRPHVLDAAAERALKPGDSFKECAEDCPEMVVIPAGEFTMGVAGERARAATTSEEPQHRVRVRQAIGGGGDSR